MKKKTLLFSDSLLYDLWSLCLGGASVSCSNKINRVQQRFLTLLPGNNSYKLIRINYSLLNFQSLAMNFKGVKFYESQINRNHLCTTSIIDAHHVMNIQQRLVIIVGYKYPTV